MPTSDWNGVECTRWREAVSALADGEPAEIDERLVAVHLARCPACRSYQESIRLSPHDVGSSPSSPVPDLPRTVSKLNAAADRVAHWSVLRLLLAIVAVQVIGFALPALLLGREGAVATHAARHLGAFGVAYGVALLVVVVRPARARSILPVAMVLAGAQVLAAIVDGVSGTISLFAEARHLPQIISLVLIWFLAVPSTGRRGRRPAPADRPRLEIVDDSRRVS